MFLLLLFFLPIPTLCLSMHPVVGIMLIYVLSSSICVDYYSSFYLSLLSLSSLPLVGIMLICVSNSITYLFILLFIFLPIPTLSIFLPLVGIIMICVSYYHLFIYIIIHLYTYPYSLYLPYLWLL